MPSSGYKSADLFRGCWDASDGTEAGDEEAQDRQYQAAVCIEDAAKVAMECGLFVEWLEQFVGCWNETKNPFTAAQAGLIEWDM